MYYELTLYAKNEDSLFMEAPSATISNLTFQEVNKLEEVCYEFDIPHKITGISYDGEIFYEHSELFGKEVKNGSIKQESRSYRRFQITKKS